MTPDFTLTKHGAVCLVHPLNDDARAHLEVHTSEEALWFSRALVVEPRYVEGVLSALAEAGFTCEEI